MHKVYAYRIVILIGLFLFSFQGINAQTATWTGSMNHDWNNPLNWSWGSEGSGIPNNNTDVVFEGFFMNYPTISDTAKCKNILFIETYLGVSQLVLQEGAELHVNGDIMTNNEINGQSATIKNFDANTGINTSGTIIFQGNADQRLSNIQISLAHIKIEKEAGNVNMEGGSFISYSNSLELSSTPVASGTASVGNLIVDSGALEILPQVDISIPAYTSSQTPPHIITTSPTDFSGNANGIILIINGANGAGLNGQVVIPISPSKMTYCPISITDHTGNAWAISVTRDLPVPCSSSSFNINEAVQNLYTMIPLNIQTGVPINSLPNGANISVTYNNSISNEDISTDFNTSQQMRLWFVTNDNCYDLIDASQQTTDGVYTTVICNEQQAFPTFAIKSESNVGVERIKQSISCQLFPNPADNALNVCIQDSHPALNMEITDAFGKKIITKQYTPNALNIPKRISLNNIASGVYFIRFTGKDVDYVTKFIVE